MDFDPSMFNNTLVAAISDQATLQLPDPDLLTYYLNYNEKRVWLDGIIDEDVMSLARLIVRWNTEDRDIPVEQRKPIWLYMFNYGGDADYMWMLIDLIKTSKTPIYTVNFGLCASAAALIFMAGHKRWMMPGASVVIHEGSGQIAGDAVKVLDNAEIYKKSLDKMRKYILANTNIPSARLTRKKNNDWSIEADECLKYGVCDAIVENIADVI